MTWRSKRISHGLLPSLDETQSLSTSKPNHGAEQVKSMKSSGQSTNTLSLALAWMLSAVTNLGMSLVAMGKTFASTFENSDEQFSQPSNR